MNEQERTNQKLTRERDNARRDRDAIAEEFKVYRADKQLVDKALWLIAHDFLMGMIYPEKMPRAEKPKDNDAFMVVLESVVAKALMAAQRDTGTWESDETRRVVRDRGRFMPGPKAGETMH